MAPKEKRGIFKDSSRVTGSKHSTLKNPNIQSLSGITPAAGCAGRRSQDMQQAVQMSATSTSYRPVTEPVRQYITVV
ncbi:hypothetical protein POX_c03806 [Penicillium oxalicum]|uniref:Uncharacterized protein n=1 Tax=Penicillium oxalicum (strain 114-2 / CGMCC 5302) TaxID=933388 RepID=S8AI73_PENO1|nr:hypothetical protein POX_c03806 [Penicillium oxalicum]EPS25413.1 hypothetical protein PDE_00346 [Penicillium oxalicum 114-2]KAI2790953.1 hypothetical protein POX_c03806 [Penicillium oxalicum]